MSTISGEDMILTLQQELRVLETENTQLRVLAAKSADRIDELADIAAIAQSQRVEEMTTENTVSVSVDRVKVINGGYAVERLSVVVGLDDNKLPSVLGAYDSRGLKTGLKKEERIVAIAHANGGWYAP
jgi:hypothetical protein